MPGRGFFKMPPLTWLLVSVVLLSALVVVAAFATPALRQAVHLRWLISSDPHRQQQALAYLAAHAADRPQLVERALQQVVEAPPAVFTRVVGALDAAGQWSPQRVPTPPWLRWVTLLAQEEGVAARLLAIDQLLRPVEIDGEAAAPLLRKLLADEDADVRLAAVLAAAELLGAAPEPASELIGLVTRARHDASPLVARHAWLVLGLLNVAPVPTEKLGDAEVAEAAIWAAAVSSSQGLRQARKLGQSAEDAHHDLPAAVYAVSQVGAADGSLLREVAHQGMHGAGGWLGLAAWRAVLGLGHAAGQRGSPEDLLRTERGEPLPAPLELAVLYAMGDPQRADATRPRQVLAALEGAAPASLHWPIDDATPPAHRLAAIRANRFVQPDDFYPLLRHADATIRDRAAVLAVDRLARSDTVDLAERLLREPDVESQMGGAVLAGLLGVHRDLIERRLGGTPDWPVRPVLELALWMQGAPASREPDLLLLREDLPHTTVLLAMLHRGRTGDAMDALLAPHGEPLTDLTDLLLTRRWWPVVRRYLPEDAPPLWPWADRRLTALQIDTLRNWATLHRRR